MSHVFAEKPVAVHAGRHDAFAWRFICTVISFTAFGIGVVLFSVTLMPALRLLPADRCRRVSRSVLQRGMRMFVGMMRGLGGMTYEFQDVAKLGQPGQLIVANHPTLLDAVFLIAFTPQACCIAKHAIFRNLFTRSVVKAAGYISNASTADLIGGTAAALREGQCVIMFPEGTRTRLGEPLAFHRGAANIAVRAARLVTPVYIDCNPITLTKGQPWYRIPPRRPHFSLRTGEELPLDAFRRMPSVPLGSRAFNEHLRQHFQDHLR